MLKIIKADGAAEKKQIEDMRARVAQTGEGISAVAAAVLQDVRENGYAAVEKYSLQFDGAKPREITAEELDAAYESCPKELIAAMEQAAADIRDYNEKLLVRSAEWRNPAGGIVGRVIALKEDTFVLETGSDRTKIRFRRAAVQAVNKLEMETPAQK